MPQQHARTHNENPNPPSYARENRVSGSFMSGMHKSEFDDNF